MNQSNINEQLPIVIKGLDVEALANTLYEKWALKLDDRVMMPKNLFTLALQDIVTDGNCCTEADSDSTAQNEQVSQPTANEMLAEVPAGLNSLAKSIFLKNKKKWNYPDNQNIGEVLCLLHSEVSEALEADRKGSYCVLYNDTVLEMINKPDFTDRYKSWVKGTFEEEMADILIRLLDLCGSKDIDIETHLKAKLRFNFMNGTNGKKY